MHANSQTCDIVTDSLVWAQKAQVYEFNASAAQLSCPYDPELLHPGHNITLSSNIIIGAMGPDAAHFGIGNVTPGVTWDSCRGYNFYSGFCHFTLTDLCGNILAQTSKAMYDVASGQYYLATGDPDFNERITWLHHYGNPDVSSMNSGIDSGFSTDIAPIIYYGFRDQYSKNQYGNWLNIEAIIPILVIGQQYIFSVDLTPFMINEGPNIYPNKASCLVTWNGGTVGTYSITVTGTVNTTIPLPVASTDVQNNSRVISWDLSARACSYLVQRKQMDGNQEKFSGPEISVSGTTFTDLTALPGFSYRWYIKARNAAGSSVGVGTKKIRLNH